MSHSATLILFTLCSLIPLIHSAAVPTADKPTCPCRARTTANVNICAVPAGDPAWCLFHMCSAGFECIDPAWATHTCVVSQTVGVYKCEFNDHGMVVKPRPHETDRCRCVHHDKQVIHHVTPIE